MFGSATIEHLCGRVKWYVGVIRLTANQGGRWETSGAVAKRSIRIAIGGLGLALTLAACSSAAAQPPGPVTSEEYEIVTLLPKDAIPSIDRPQFYSVQEANVEYEEDEVVIGVEFDGDARAYPIGLLSSHEIVNDTVGGRPIAVTW